MNFLLGLIDKTDPTKSLREAAYGFGIFMSAVWLTIALFQKAGMDATWATVFSIFVAAITGAKVWSEKAGTEVSSTPGITSIIKDGEREVKK